VKKVFIVVYQFQRARRPRGFVATSRSTAYRQAQDLRGDGIAASVVEMESDHE
jgi:hypothetical protein